MNQDEGRTEEWFHDYFDGHFLRIYRSLLPAEDAQEEAAAIIQALELEPGEHLLDLACGWGRHAIPFAAAGLNVTAVDRSEHLLREAARGGANVSWICADVRELPFRKTFRAAVSLFSSLGYFLNDGEDLRALTAVRNALLPEGFFLLETMHRDSIVREYAERDWWDGPGGEVVRVEREFDAVSGISRERLLWHHPTIGQGEKLHSIRVRSASEWQDLLREAGFETVGWFGSWDLEPFTHRSERLIVVARS
ncbi:class I SAM-dependent methyltransferase [soil metagenome]